MGIPVENPAANPAAFTALGNALGLKAGATLDLATQASAAAGSATTGLMNELLTKQSVTVNAELGTFTPAVTGPSVRTNRQKGNDRRDIRDYNGVDLTGANASTAEVQRAFNDCRDDGGKLWFPPCDLVVDETITVDTRLSVEGASFPANDAIASWIKFAHSGIGFAGNVAAALFRNLGVKRDQPAIAPGWAPNDHAFDFDMFGQDVRLENVTLLNPTRAIRLGGGGRLVLNGVRGQPLLVGLDIERSYDVCRINDVHFWPFWNAVDIPVRTYTQANLIAFRSGRNDNPFYSNIFSIWHRVGVQFYAAAATGEFTPGGITSKAKFVNSDIDIGITAVDVLADGVTADFIGFSCQGLDGTGGSSDALVKVSGDGNDINFIAPRFTQAGGNIVRIDGDNSTVTLSEPQTGTFDTSGIGFPAFEEGGSGSKIVISGDVRASVPITTSGDVRIPNGAWVAYTPTVAALSGTITTASASGYYNRRGKTVTVTTTITIPTNGTGASGISFTLPFAADARFYVGAGRETAVNGKGLSVTVEPSSSVGKIAAADNLYPGVDGAVIVASVTYEVP